MKKLLTAFALLALAVYALATVPPIPNFVVQHGGGNSLGLPADNCSASLSSAITANDPLIAIARSTAGGARGISDSAGDSFTHLVVGASTLLGSIAYIDMWAATAKGSGSGTSFSFSMNSSSLNSSCLIYELSPSYSGTLTAHTSGSASSYYRNPNATTSDGNLMQVPMPTNPNVADLFEISLVSPANGATGVSFGIVVINSINCSVFQDSTQCLEQDANTFLFAVVADTYVFSPSSGQGLQEFITRNFPPPPSHRFTKKLF